MLRGHRFLNTDLNGDKKKQTGYHSRLSNNEDWSAISFLLLTKTPSQRKLKIPPSGLSP